MFSQILWYFWPGLKAALNSKKRALVYFQIKLGGVCLKCKSGLSCRPKRMGNGQTTNSTHLGITSSRHYRSGKIVSSRDGYKNEKINYLVCKWWHWASVKAGQCHIKVNLVKTKFKISSLRIHKWDLAPLLETCSDAYFNGRGWIPPPSSVL